MNRTRSLLLMAISLVFCSIIESKVSHAAELGAPKAPQANKGPTLEETTKFISDKWPEFSDNSYKNYGIIHNTTVSDTDKTNVANFDGCDVTIVREYRHYVYAHDGDGANSNDEIRTSRFNLKNLINVKVTLYQDGNEYFVRNGSPFYAVRLVTNNGNIDCGMKSQEYATRLSKAFEHAAQLCGGGKEIGKKELF